MPNIIFNGEYLVKCNVISYKAGKIKDCDYRHCTSGPNHCNMIRNKMKYKFWKADHYSQIICFTMITQKYNETNSDNKTQKFM